MVNSFKNAFSGLRQELLDGVRTSAQDAAIEERIIGIENATAAML